MRDTVRTSWSADDICFLILNISCWSDILVLYVFSSTLPVLACYRTEVRSNQEGDARDRVRVREVQPVHIWSPCKGVQRPQAIGVHTVKTTRSSPKTTSRMMMRLQKYTFEVSYERGQNMHLADTLPRAYLPTEGNPQDHEFKYINMASYLPIAEERLEEIRRETRNDPSLQELKCVITLGWPEDKSKVAPQVHPFFSIRDELTIQDGLIFRGKRVVVPQSLRPMIKTKLHSSHMGIDACLRRARESVFWPGFSAEIKQMVETCETCRKFETSPQKEPLVSHDVPLRPWEKIGVDIFELNGKEYLTTVDYCSNFWEIDKLPTDAKATTVIAKLKDHFARYSIPDQVVTDNGPQFKSQEFANFAAAYEFEHTPTSPYNSKGNGKVESAVKTTK